MTGDPLTPDPYVEGWRDCAEAIAGLLEIKAQSVDKSSLRQRLIAPMLAGVYRHAAEIARATTEVSGA
jgi:hypothetical protein